MHRYQDLISLFDNTFFEQFNTRLELGDNEPVYLPADAGCSYHRIIFAHGFYASAMHEIAHWCVAGPERRQQEDYGYWYEPDGRNAQRQAEFESVEIRPQAFEWILSQCAGFPFQVSCDNLHGEVEPDRWAFTEKVRREVAGILSQDLPPRLGMLAGELQRFYQTPSLHIEQFKLG